MLQLAGHIPGLHILIKGDSLLAVSLLALRVNIATVAAVVAGPNVKFEWWHESLANLTLS